MKLITTLALMVVFGALLLSMESAQGIKCFYCPTPCADETKQTERDCEDYWRAKDDGTPGAMSKGCKTAQQKEEAEKIGIKDYGPTDLPPPLEQQWSPDTPAVISFSVLLLPPLLRTLVSMSTSSENLAWVPVPSPPSFAEDQLKLFE
ncbi:Phosphatidate cytidylyltransferase 2 [Orchesella cincta]|uniref:Phosphatidate cytidylyltransferase 2 n=1 Tax=Orchesella cincta TaxID=48709 RepID=A0A1D2M9Q7_ORCCI|nr:Phosphatidate cytidylyltransferase 2 [Orchesella cincta]